MRLSRSAARLALISAVVLLAGCGVGRSVNPVNNSHTLTIYSSLPLQGPDHARQQSIVNGEKLALYQAGGHVGSFHVSFYSLDDSNPVRGTWSPDITSQAARMAAQDTTTIAYIGDFDSGATAISLPLINESGALQVSPASPYVGLTEANPIDDKGEPDRYYPTGERTFARLRPSDVSEASALVAYMRSLGVRSLYVLQDLGVFDAAIGSMVAKQFAATSPGGSAAVTGPVQVDTRAQTPAAYAAFASKVAQAHPDAVLFGASPGPGAVAVWSALHAAAPSVKLFAPSTLATPAFVAALGPAASATYVTSPVLQARFYPPAARRVLREYRSTFGVAPSVFALYGYEAMKAVLAAIRAAGRHGGNRRSVVRAFFALRNHSSVLGDYSVLADGDVTLARFGGYRVSAHGRLRFEQLLP